MQPWAAMAGGPGAAAVAAEAAAGAGAAPLVAADVTLPTDPQRRRTAADAAAGGVATLGRCTLAGTLRQRHRQKTVHPALQGCPALLASERHCRGG